MPRPTPIVLTLLLAAGVAAGAQTRGRPPGGPRMATITGEVFDSVSGTHLAHALVQFYAASDSATKRMFTTQSDSLGRFALDSVPMGAYLAGFFHPALDSLGIESKPRGVLVSSPAQRVDLASPSPAQLTATICGASAPRDSSALLIGHVRRAESEEPIAGASIRLEWYETVIDKARGLRGVNRTATARSIDGGWFALCGVPSGFLVAMRASFEGDTSGYIEHEAAANGVEHLTFLVGHARRVIIADTSRDDTRLVADTVRLLRGGARLSGLILTDKGQPAPNAQLEIAGTGATARTNDVGRFGFDSLPTGTYSLTVRAIGYTPVESIVQLAEARPAMLELRLPERAVMLAAVDVHASTVYSAALMEFENHRRRSVSGHFFVPLELEGKKYLPLMTYVQQAPNVRVDRIQGAYSVTMRASNGHPGRCTPALYENGRRSLLEFDMFNEFIDPERLLGVEVYTNTTGIPGEYVDPRNDGCGVIAVWTQSRLPKPKSQTPN